MQSLAAEAAASPFPDLLEEARSFSAQVLASLKDRPTEDVLALVRSYRDNLADARLRYAELFECAMDAERLETFATRLRHPGRAATSHAPIHHAHRLPNGWNLTDRNQPHVRTDTPP